jgi:hypothetical protein
MEKKGGLLTKDEAVEAMQQENSHLPSSSRGQRGLYKLKFFAIAVLGTGDVQPGFRIFFHPGYRIQRKKEQYCEFVIRCFFSLLTPESGIGDKKIRILDP